MKKTFAVSVAGLALGIASASFGQTYTSAFVSNAIVDGVGGPAGTPGPIATLDLVIADATVINNNLFAGMIVSHTWQGDVVVTLTHVDTATSVILVNRPGSNAALGGAGATAFGVSVDNYGNPALPGTGFMFFRDDATSTYATAAEGGTPGIGAGVANVVGNWDPRGGSMAAFNGQTLNGTWRLSAQDWAGGDVGALRQLQIGIIPAPGALALLGLAGLVGGRRRRA